MPAVGRTEEIVDGVGLAGFLLPVVGIGEQRLGARSGAHEQLEGIVARSAPGEEQRPVRQAPQFANDRIERIVEFGHALEQLCVAGQPPQSGVGMVGLRLHPRGDGRVVHVLHGTVGIVHDRAEEGILHGASDLLQPETILHESTLPLIAPTRLYLSDAGFESGLIRSTVRGRAGDSGFPCAGRLPRRKAAGNRTAIAPRFAGKIPEKEGASPWT